MTQCHRATFCVWEAEPLFLLSFFISFKPAWRRRTFVLALEADRSECESCPYRLRLVTLGELPNAPEPQAIPH